MKFAQYLATIGIASGIVACRGDQQEAGAAIVALQEQPARNIRENAELCRLGDSVGNRNYKLDVLEEDYMRRVLHQSTGTVYLMTQYAENRFILYDGVERSNDARLFSSEEELRTAYNGVGIRGQVGILGFDGLGRIVGAWHSSGYIAKSVWTAVPLPSSKELEKILDY